MSDQSRHRNSRRGPSYVPLLSLSTRDRPASRGEADIHVCARCRSELVQPVEWAAVDSRRWRVELRCPECTYRSTATYSQRVLSRFEARLERATEALLDDLAMLERDSMEHEIATFTEALARNLVLPEDF